MYLDRTDTPTVAATYTARHHVGRPGRIQEGARSMGAVD